MQDPARRTDRELFEGVASGDAASFAELTGRHARGLYDFALRSTLDEQQASAVVQATFQRVRQPRAQIPSHIDFRTWLYSLCLIEILPTANELRTGRLSTDDERFYQRTTDVSPEFAKWAWQAARGLRTRDYCVLDLTLRRGLTPEEVAEAASLTRSNLYASIGRARGAFEETYAAMVLFEYGRDACRVLDEMVENAPGSSLRPALRHQIIEHAEDCDACRRTLDALPAGASVFVSLADIPAPDAMVRSILGGVTVYGPDASRSGQAVAGAAGAAAAAGLTGAAAITRQPEQQPAPQPSAPPPPAYAPEPEPDGDAWSRRREEPPAPAPRPVRTAQPAPVAAAPRPERAQPVYRYEEPQSRLSTLLSPRLPIVWTYVLLGIVAVLAVYLGVAFADSIQGGGGDSGAVPLDSARNGTSAGTIDCGAPLEMSPGRPIVVSFDEEALDGYRIQNISYVPVSETAAFEDLEGTLENPFLIRLTALDQDPVPPRTEEFELHIEWQRGNETATSVCQLLVNIGT